MKKITIKNTIHSKNLIYEIQAESINSDAFPFLTDHLNKYCFKGLTKLVCFPKSNDIETSNIDNANSGNNIDSTLEQSIYSELPDCLQYVKPLSSKFLMSDTRKEIIDGIVRDINVYLNSAEEQTALIILVDGIHGTGKSWLLRYAAKKAGLTLYRPVGIVGKYAGETAKMVEEILQFVRHNEWKKVSLLWDEIDEIGLSRGSGTDSMSRDARNVIATLFRGIDETRFVLLCTTNTYEDLDKAFRSRIKPKKRTLKLVEEPERFDFLKQKCSSREVDIPYDRIKELSTCTWNMGFRDLDSIVEGLQRWKNKPNSVYVAWRKAVGEDRSIDEIWGTPIESEIHSKLNKKIWDVWTSRNQNTILISTKGNRTVIGNIKANGFLRQSKVFTTTNDVNASIYLEERDILVMCTDDGIEIIRHAIKGKNNKRYFKLDDWVRDVEIIDDSNLLFVTDKGSLYFLRTKGRGKPKKLLENKQSFYSIDLLESRNGELICLFCEKYRNNLRVASIKNPLSRSKRYYDINWRCKESLESTSEMENRPQIFSENDNSKIIVLATDDKVKIWRWTYSKNLCLINQISAKGVSSAAIDPVTGKVAVLYKDKITIYRTYFDTSVIEPSIIKLDAYVGNKITSARFAAFGQILVWGDRKGGIYSVKSAPPKSKYQ